MTLELLIQLFLSLTWVLGIQLTICRAVYLTRVRFLPPKKGIELWLYTFI